MRTLSRIAPCRVATWLFCCSILASCATPPKVDAVIEQKSDSGKKTVVVNARGPLSDKEAKELIAKLGGNAKDTDLLKKHLLVEQEVAETPLVDGNDVRLLRDGEQTFSAMFSLIKSAKNNINLEYFIFEDVKHGGTTLGDLLVAKRQQGVAINVIYDGFGSITTPPEFIDRLKKAGVKVIKFNPLNLLHATSANNRDHRKILVVDGATAIVGGVNLSIAYESSRLRRSATAPATKGERWRDTDIMIKGPAAADLQKLFLQHWVEQKAPALTEAEYFPRPVTKGNEVVRIIGSTPDDQLPRYYVTLLSAIRSSDKSIYLSSAYFVPTHDEKDALIAASKRGVDVRIYLPGISDSPTSIDIQHSHYEDLLEAGIKVYESNQEVLHAKTITVDGVWTVVGSSNLDHRSLLLNDEVDVVVIGKETSRELQAMFEDDLKDAKEITLDEWKKRSPILNIKDKAARFWEDML